MVRDVTEGKRAEHQARDLRQELAHMSRVSTLAALTGSLAHEIRQPLAAIRTNAQAAAALHRPTESQIWLNCAARSPTSLPTASGPTTSSNA